MNFDYRNEICKDTCIVIDRCSQFLQNSGSKLEIDSNQKNRGNSLLFLSTLQKTTWTCIVEGVSEYCRIVYDIFPSDYKVQVICSDEVVSNVNTFEDEEQSIQQVLRGFAGLGPPKRISEWTGSVSIYPGVAQGAEILLSRNKDSSRNGKKRLIVITALEDEGDSNSISNVVWEIQNEQGKDNVCDIDVVVINITNKNESFSSNREVSNHLNITTLSFKNLYCINKIAKLTRNHYNLHSTIITGIPMKEEQNAGSSANYDVEIIHSSLAHIDSTWSTQLSNTKDPSLRPPVTLKWCTPKANTIPDLQPCIGAYRVTPSEVNSRPAACLIMFLLQGRTVMLEAPKKTGTKILTHMLQCHGGDVYIHVLAAGKSPLEDPPSISEGIGGRVTDYRVNDFGKLMKENRLAPYSDNLDEKPQNLKGFVSELCFINPFMFISDGESLCIQTAERLKRYSKHWPMIISDTLIFNMTANLEPLLSLLLKPVLTEDEVQECKKVVYKLQAMESRSDSLPLPIVTLKGKGTKKEEQYKQVWSELDSYIEGASTTSILHQKVLDCIRGDQEAGPDTKKTDVEMKEADPTTADKTWTELDHYQKMTEREKTAFNEAPSDPRRRRRTSESSSKPIEQLQGIKSPSRLEEPIVKVKRSKKRHHTSNVTNNIQAKTSLLSIWSNHLNVTASRLHDDFYGRKQALNGKFELYQKDPEQISQAEAKTKSKSADWV